MQRLFKVLSVPQGEWRAQGPSWMHPYQCACFFLPGVKDPVAWIGKLHPRLSCDAWAAEIIMDALTFDDHRPNYALPALQPVCKDLSFFVPPDQPVGPVLTAMDKAGQSVLTGIRLIDLFRDEQATDQNQALSVSIQATFQPKDHQSFTAAQLYAHMDTLVQCAQRHGWALRGSLPIDQS